MTTKSKKTNFEVEHKDISAPVAANFNSILILITIFIALCLVVIPILVVITLAAM